MAKRPTRSEQIASMSANDRLELAREKANKLVDHCIELERIHANNRHLIFRDVFAGNLSHTFAGNAYESLRLTSFSFEVVRLMALWDKPAANVFSIPEVVALIDHPDVIGAARRDCVAQYSHPYESFASEAALRFDLNVRRVRKLAEAIPKSHRFKTLKKHRNKFYAHNLDDPAVAPKFGYERKLLWSSEKIVNALRGALSSAGLDFPATRELCRRHANEFWQGVSWARP